MKVLPIKQKFLFFILFVFLALPVFAWVQKSEKEKQVVYKLNIDYKTVHFTDQAKQAMAINNSIPSSCPLFS